MAESLATAAPKSFNIASTLVEQSTARPFQRGVVFPDGRDSAGRVAWTHLTFRDLNKLSDEYARGLVSTGVQPGDRVSLLVKPCLEFIPLVFAIFKIGAVPVLIDPGMGRKEFLACVQHIQPRVLIGEPIVFALKGLFSKSFQSVKIQITMGRSTWWWGGSTLEQCRIASEEPFPTVVSQRHDEAAILFTSGSTGPAKGVTYTHGIFSAQVSHIQEMYDIQPGEIDLACFPLFGLFSMAMGMTVVIPDMDPTKPALADPRKLIEAIQTQGCTSAFGSPAIWKNVAKLGLQESVQLPSMRRILMAGAPVPVWMHEAFQNILPEGAQLHTPYGATESLPVSSIASHEVLQDTQERTRNGGGSCVGQPAPGVDIRIIKITDEPISDWSDAKEMPVGGIGEICVRGEVVTREYKGRPEQTAAAKIWQGDEPFHRMGDLGYFDDQNRLWFCGRKAHRVRLEDGQEMYTVPCEAIFNAHPLVYRSALVGVSGNPILVVELEPGVEAKKEALVEELLELGRANPLTQNIHRVLFHAAFPVDVRHNAKIHREELAVWAANRT
ncbi:MAG: fatty acid CoA ligase family protein [Myxococcota bacterium]|nr:fatty acid CoA ligase family protein [Myxococcota bacterium]